MSQSDLRLFETFLHGCDSKMKAFETEMKVIRASKPIVWLSQSFSVIFATIVGIVFRKLVIKAILHFFKIVKSVVFYVKTKKKTGFSSRYKCRYIS